MTRAAVPHRLAEFALFYLDALEELARREIADLKSQQSIDGDEAACFFAVDGERANLGMKRPDRADRLILLGVHDRQQRRVQAGAVDARSIKTAHGVMRSA